MGNKTPTTMGDRGLETLAGTLKLKIAACGASWQPSCGDCISYTTDLTQHAEFGHCKRLDPDDCPDAGWPLVSGDAYCPSFRPIGAGGSRP